MLLTMATGTGKTFVALQVVWKLWERRWPEGRRPRVLYLADRNILVDQPITREFRPVFGEAVWKIQGATNTSREVYFALYQALADTTDDLGVLQEYPSDFFDLVSSTSAIVEARETDHRGDRCSTTFPPRSSSA